MASGSSGVKQDDLAAAGNAQAQAQSAYNNLMPTYQQFATGTDGLTAQQKANSLTASGQSLGGAVGAATATGNLDAARTGNAGGYQAVLDAAARGGMQQQSANALGVQQQSDALAQQRQGIGLQGEQGIYNGANSTGASYMNLAGNVQPGFWQKYILNGQSSAGSAAAGAGGA